MVEFGEPMALTQKTNMGIQDRFINEKYADIQRISWNRCAADVWEMAVYLQVAKGEALILIKFK